MAEENKEKEMKFVTISAGWDGCPLAYHLDLEGADSILGQIQDVSERKNDDEPEESDDKKQRLSQYNGMMKKYSARKIVNALKKVDNKDEYFIFVDQNALWAYSEELLEAGFTKGLFPTKKDYEFEKGREEAMDFVEKNYPDIKIIPHQKFSTPEEARKYVEDCDVPLVIQSEGDFVATICPVDDVEQNHIEILSALDRHAKEYAQGEIILKEKLVQPVEITPEMVFWNGEPVFTDIDIETKNIGDGENNGNQVGCGSNLIIKTELDDKINKIAFPPIVYQMAKEHTGLFFWDISLYFTDKGIYFGEFCSNRPGYDSSMTECAMSGGALPYFNAIVSLKNPLQSKFGTAVRVFNLNRTKDQNITVGDDKNTWLYEAKKDKDQLTSVGDCWDLGVITGKGETVEEAIEDVYKNYDTLTFKEKYVRTKADFLADYPTSIIHRYKSVNHKYFEASDFNEPELSAMSKDIKDISSKVDDGLSKLHSALYDVMNQKKKTENVKGRLRDKIKNILNDR